MSRDLDVYDSLPAGTRAFFRDHTHRLNASYVAAKYPELVCDDSPETLERLAAKVDLELSAKNKGIRRG